jgi:hypothetical protein
MLPSASSDSVGVLIERFRSSMSQPTYSPHLRFTACLAAYRAKLGAERIAIPFSWRIFVSCFLPVYPGAFQRYAFLAFLCGS